ncbi:Caudovirales tail fibre assembly protein [Providencia stuartii]|nr:Caudovirales tail fibre assembly protein [Providencia stuartii]
MKYYKDTNLNVYAYDDEQLAQVTRLTELELLLNEKQPLYISAHNNLELAASELEDANALLNATLSPSLENSDEETAENEEEIQRLTLLVQDKTNERDNANTSFLQIEAEYQPLKMEFDAILPVFFDIREHLKVFKKMNNKEVEAYLNPPISKEQLIAGAEQQKQLLLAEANNAIAPLQDAIDLGMATEAETAALQAWKKYRVLLNRVDTSTAPNIDWPEKPE